MLLLCKGKEKARSIAETVAVWQQTVGRCIIDAQKTVGEGRGGGLLTVAINCVHGGLVPTQEEPRGSQAAEGAAYCGGTGGGAERGRASERERERRREFLSLCCGLPILRM